MRRFARRLFTVLSALSLLLCAAVCVLWVRSHHALEELTYSSAVRDGGSEDLSLSHYYGVARVGVYVFRFPRAERDRFIRSGTLGRSQSVLGRESAPWDGLPRGVRRRYQNYRGQGRFGWEVERGPYLNVQGMTLLRHTVCAPYWSLCGALLVLPTGWAVDRWRRRARGPCGRGICPACNYDLTGNVSGTCPECGAPMPGEKGVS